MLTIQWLREGAEFMTFRVQCVCVCVCICVSESPSHRFVSFSLHLHPCHYGFNWYVPLIAHLRLHHKCFFDWDLISDWIHGPRPRCRGTAWGLEGAGNVSGCLVGSFFLLSTANNVISLKIDYVLVLLVILMLRETVRYERWSITLRFLSFLCVQSWEFPCFLSRFV